MADPRSRRLVHIVAVIIGVIALCLAAGAYVAVRMLVTM